MSETLSEQVLRVITDFEWIGTQRRLGEMWAIDIAALEARLEAMEQFWTRMDILVHALAVPRWIRNEIAAAQKESEDA